MAVLRLGGKKRFMRRTAWLALVILATISSLFASAAPVGAQTGASWGQVGSDIDGARPDDEFGGAVAVSADGYTIAVGAMRNDDSGNGSGNVRIFKFNGTTWRLVGLDIEGESAGDLSGGAVSLSADGNTVAIGAIFNDGNGNNSGHVRVYELNGNTWTQLGRDINGENADDLSGGSVALSDDGRTVAIGATGNDGSGSNAGHVRIYALNRNGTRWNQIGQDIDGQTVGDQSGTSVALSDDGNTVAIGAIFNTTMAPVPVTSGSSRSMGTLGSRPAKTLMEKAPVTSRVVLFRCPVTGTGSRSARSSMTGAARMPVTSASSSSLGTLGSRPAKNSMAKALATCPVRRSHFPAMETRS